MPRGCRFIILAIVGLILAGNAQPVSKDARSNSPAEQNNQKPASHPDITVSVSRISDALEAQNDKADPYEKERNEREIRDLQAQENSAYWAAAMFWATATALLISIVGIGLVWTTFRETRKANSISRESMHRQLRAYVTIDEAEHDHEDTWQYVTLTLNNSGSTPAINIAVHSIMFDIADGAASEKTIETKVRDIGGQTKFAEKVKWYNWQGFMEARLPIPDFISGKVTYSVCIPNENGETVSFDVQFQFEPVSTHVSDKRMSLPGKTYF
jgi:hypothetical protein